jgi:hypothetical protein
MLVKINPQIAWELWPGFVPLASLICLFPIVVAFGRYKKRQLLRMLLWLGALATIWTAYLTWIIVTLSANAI